MHTPLLQFVEVEAARAEVERRPKRAKRMDWGCIVTGMIEAKIETRNSKNEGRWLEMEETHVSKVCRGMFL